MCRPTTRRGGARREDPRAGHVHEHRRRCGRARGAVGDHYDPWDAGRRSRTSPARLDGPPGAVVHGAADQRGREAVPGVRAPRARAGRAARGAPAGAPRRRLDGAVLVAARAWQARRAAAGYGRDASRDERTCGPSRPGGPPALLDERQTSAPPLRVAAAGPPRATEAPQVSADRSTTSRRSSTSRRAARPAAPPAVRPRRPRCAPRRRARVPRPVRPDHLAGRDRRVRRRSHRRQLVTCISGEWLDPEPPFSAHTEVTCRRELPPIRTPQDVGRRFRCGTCGRAYKAHNGDQREPGAYWTRRPEDDKEQS